jgi:peptidoglycan/LPS O-acetylase OafA/YrhL
MLAASVPEATTIYNWLGSLFFLQGIACAPFGSNGPLWSLSYEFWYYLLFPLLYLAVTTVGTPRSIKVKAAMAVIGVAIVTFIGPEMRLYFCIWLLGAAVAMLDPIPLARTRRALWVSVLAFAAALVWNRLAKGNMEGQFIRDAILGATCAFSLYVLLCQQRGHRINEGSRLAFLARFTGNVSFSLYLLHLPFLVFVNGQVIGSGGRWIPDGVHVAALFGIACLSFAYVILIWRFTEAKTEIVRRYAVRAFLPPYISQKKNPS